jgi:biotin operon repressor
MSFEAMAWAVKQKLPVKQKIVLLMLADRINKDTGRCDPSIPRLAEDCGMSESSVKEALRALKEDGLVVAHERKMGVVNLPNQYEIVTGEIPGVGRIAPGGGSPRAPGVGRIAPPNLEDQPVREPSIASLGLFSEENGIEPNGSTGDLSPSQRSETTGSVTPREDEFEAFWKAYPPGRKTDKPKARSLFWSIVQGKSKSIPKTPAETIIAGARTYARTGPDPKFVPLPTTWLNGARWEVEDMVPARPASTYRGEVVR